jgi:dipeptidyl aminopeptidase/acylaminoacyl peptidase
MAQPLTPERIIYDLATAGDPQVSPDGTHLLYTRTQAVRGRKRAGSQIWLCAIDGSDQRQLTSDGERNSGARWSPDGASFAYVSNTEDGSTLFIQQLDGGEAREVAFHTTSISAVSWSPDDSTIAYNAAFDPDNPNDAKPGPEDPPPVRVVSRVDYKQDNRGFLNDVRQQVWLVNVADGARRMLTSDAVDHLVPMWSPDGRTIAVKIPNRNGMHSQLALIDVATGAETLIGSVDGNVGCWGWADDSNRLLLAADTAQTWQLDLFLYTCDSGELKRLTDDLPCQPDFGFPTVTLPSQPIWIDDSTAVFHALEHGSSGLFTIDVMSGEVDQLLDFRAINTGLSADRDGRYFAQASSGMSRFGDIMVFDRETMSAYIVVHMNADILGETPETDWERFDVQRGQFTIEAWLLKPPGFDESRKYPLVLDIHGGPNSWYGYAPSPMQRALVNAGFLVVYSNPRGSGSYGREFTHQVINDWGGEDYLDLMAVVDTVLERPYADGDRLGVYGYSYGGFMSSWIIGHTDRFKAAVIGAPVVDLVSFYGTADIGHTFGPMQIEGTPHTNLEEYRFRSPLTYLRECATPVLIVHGEQDDRVPIGQGEQLFTTLAEQGCEVEFVRYPGGSHASVTRTGYPAHRFDYLDRLVGWFERWL